MKSIIKMRPTKCSQSKKFLTYCIICYYFTSSTLVYAGGTTFENDKDSSSKLTVTQTLDKPPSSVYRSCEDLRQKISSNLRQQVPNYRLFSSRITEATDNIRFFLFKIKQEKINKISSYLPTREHVKNIQQSFLSFLKKPAGILGEKPWSFFHYAHAEMKTLPQLTNNELKKVQERIGSRQRELDKILASSEIKEPITILLGNREAGKFTVLQYELQAPLKAYEDDTGKICLNDHPNLCAKGLAKFRGRFNSKTKIPILRDNWVYCPGLLDTDGPEAEILSAHFLSQLLEQSPKVRFLLVVPESQLEEGKLRGGIFFKLTEDLSKMLEGNSVNDLKQGLNVVVTQGTYLDVSGFQNAIEIMLNDRDNTFRPLQKELLQWMANPKNEQITIFQRPKDEGEIPMQGRKKLISPDAPYVENLKVNVTYSPEATEYVRQIIKGLTLDFTQCLEDFNAGFRQDAEQLVRSHDGDANSLRELIKSSITPLQEVQDQEQTFNEDTRYIDNALAVFNPVLKEKFSKLQDQRKFLLSVKPKGDKVDLTFNKKCLLNKIVSSANKLSTPPHCNRVNTTCIFQGEIIGTSDIVRNLSDLDNIEMVCAYATHSLLIDDNVQMPGVSFGLAGSQWVVRGDKTISLQGRSGVDIKPEEALNGKDGQPGMPGQNGGHFYGIARQIYPGSGLTIDVSGGTGGKGQNGGNGLNGQDGIAGNLEDIEKVRDTAKVSQESLERGWWWWPFTSNTKERIVLQSGQLAEPGGDAGAGGKGGSAGLAGSIRIERYENAKYYPLPTGSQNINNEGQEGIDGEAGIPGLGGVNSEVFAGVYIKKERNKLLSRVFADATVGAVIGAKIASDFVASTSILRISPALAGSPVVGVVISATPFVVGAIGGVVGALTPFIGTKIDQGVGIWEEKPHSIINTSRANNGKQQVIPNGLNWKPAKPSIEMDISSIRQNWEITLIE